MVAMVINCFLLEEVIFQQWPHFDAALFFFNVVYAQFKNILDSEQLFSNQLLITSKNSINLET